MSILITGVAGLTGSYLLEKCMKEEVKIYGCDNFFRGTRENLQLSVDNTQDTAGTFQFAELDITNQGMFYSWLSDIQSSNDPITEIYHLAAIVPTKYFYEEPELTYETNCKATIDLFQWALKNGVKKFVNASSSEIYGHPQEVPTKETTPTHYDAVEVTTRWSYAQGKILTEHVLNHHKNEIEVCHLRYANVYGPRDLDDNHVIPYFVNQIIKNEDMIINAEADKFQRTFLYMTDCANATYSAMRNMVTGTAYNVGSKEEVTIQQLLDICLEVAKEEGIEYSGLIKKNLVRTGDPVRRVLDTSRAKSHLGYEAQVKLKDGIRELFIWTQKSMLNER